MSKTVWTPRDELVCGKLDNLERFIFDNIRDIRYDCERMEAKLVTRKVEEAILREALEKALSEHETFHDCKIGGQTSNCCWCNDARDALLRAKGGES